jgi:phenylalanyl-tRNA synthetase beta chain
MRVPLSWLREFVDIELSNEQLADALMMRGLEVRGMERWGADWSTFVVGELLEVGPHPRADRLQLTKVRISDKETLSVVCGAKNIAPGQRVPVALVGSVMPDGRLIERAEKMGVTSEGMLCSGSELNATDDGDGILILDGKAPIGMRLVDLLGEDVIDIDVKPNRGDLLSIRGLAREVAGITGAPLREVRRPLVESAVEIAQGLALRVADAEQTPRAVLRVVDSVRVGPSPDAVQMRLKAAGLRSISNVVDATNYIMLDLGKPTHAFDRSKVGTTIEIRNAKKGESLETLDHVQRSLDAADLVVADEQHALALAGVMGGASSEVGPSTSTVVIESAIFAPDRVRRSAQRHSLRSEASHRFERGQEWSLARTGVDEVAALIASWAGGAVQKGCLDSAPTPPAARQLTYRPARAARLIGVEIPEATQIELLNRIGITAQRTTTKTDIQIATGRVAHAVAGEAVGFEVPGWRRDLEFEVDAIEELARLYGYDRLAATIPSADLPARREQPTALRDALRALLAAQGLQELVTHALVAPDMLARHREPDGLVGGLLAQTEGAAAGAPLQLLNPLSLDHDHLRLSLLPSLVDRVAANQRYGATSGALFEIGRGYATHDGSVHEWTRLALATWGEVEGPEASSAARTWNLAEMKRLVATLAEAVGGQVDYAPAPATGLLHPGRSAHVRGEKIAGLIGELHPGAAEWQETPRLLLAEIAVAGLTAGGRLIAQAVLPPATPPITRDIAFALPKQVPVGELVTLARESVSEAVRIELFDLFAGGTLAASEYSAGLRFTFQPSIPGDDAGADAALTSFSATAEKRLKARRRGDERA